MEELYLYTVSKLKCHWTHELQLIGMLHHIDVIEKFLAQAFEIYLADAIDIIRYTNSLLGNIDCFIYDSLQFSDDVSDIGLFPVHLNAFVNNINGII